MVITVSKFTEIIYKKVLKPILFLFKPDCIHNVLIWAGNVIGNIMPVRWLFRELWRYDNEHTLAQVVRGVYFPNPIGLSAGFDKNFKLLNILPAIGFGFAECGSMTCFPSPGNSRPHYHRLKKSKAILVHAGLNNQGSKLLIRRISEWQQNRKVWFPLNISVAKTNSKNSSTLDKGIIDYIATLKRIKSANIGEIITINISCPNAFGGEPYTTPDRLHRLLKAVDSVGITKPVFLKMPSDKTWLEFKKLIDVSLKHNVAGLTICNLGKNRDEIIDNNIDSLKGNYSGKPLFETSNKLISQTYKYAGEKLIIIGVGGVFSADDAYEKIKLGATLVELITGLIYEGPQMIGQINYDLVKLMDSDGYTHISQAIGSYHNN